MLQSFRDKGWCKVPYDPVLADWVAATLPTARAIVAAPETQQWLRHGRTWFAGVNVLPNDGTGAVPGAPPLSGKALDFIGRDLGITGFEWEAAQVSVCYPGYPKQGTDETEAAFGYRLRRDAAHIDGLLREGPEARRHLREYHGFLLGIPMVDFSADASPFTVWEGSHEIVRARFRDLFKELVPDAWGDVDVTDAYKALRRDLFESCVRRTVWARPGEAYIVHRLALHGMAPWADGARAGPDGRMIAYFRPEIGGPEDWLNAD